MAVTRAPTAIPRTGLEKAVKRSASHGSFCRGITAVVMVFMPMKRMPVPRKIWPIFFLLPPLINMKKMMPMTAITGPNTEG